MRMKTHTIENLQVLPLLITYIYKLSSSNNKRAILTIYYSWRITTIISTIHKEIWTESLVGKLTNAVPSPLIR